MERQVLRFILKRHHNLTLSTIWKPSQPQVIALHHPFLRLQVNLLARPFATNWTTSPSLSCLHLPVLSPLDLAPPFALYQRLRIINTIKGQVCSTPSQVSPGPISKVISTSLIPITRDNEFRFKDISPLVFSPLTLCFLFFVYFVM